jgi:hypothetical protein
MAEQALHRRPDADLETALRELAEGIAWPAAGPASGSGPDLAAVVRQRIEAAPPSRIPAGSRWAWRPARRALVVAVIILLALAAIAGAATLGLRGIRLVLGPAPVSPPPSVEPSRPPASRSPGASGTPGSSGAPGAGLGLGEPLGLADLDARAGFDVAWPEDPAVGPPDAAYIDPTTGNQVALVWATRANLPGTLDPRVGLLLTQFQGFVEDGFFTKSISSGTRITVVLVDGKRAYWLSGDPHFLFYEGPKGSVHDDRRWVGDTLLWSDGPITYRLETSLGQEAAVRIAESMP